MIKKIGFVFLATIAVLFALVIANTLFDQDLDPEVRGILTTPHSFEGPCADARYAILGYGSIEPVAAGKVIYEALRKADQPLKKNELSRLGYKEFWFQDGQTTLNEEEFAAIDAILNRGVYCEFPPTLLLVHVQFMRSTQVAPLYLEALRERSAKFGARWFWQKADMMVRYFKTIVVSDTAYINQAINVAAMEKTQAFLRDRILKEKNLAAAMPAEFPNVFDFEEPFTKIASAGARFELRTTAEFLERDRAMASVMEDYMNDPTTMVLKRYFFRFNETLNDYWDLTRKSLKACEAPGPECVGAPTEVPGFSLINPMGRLILRAFNPLNAIPGRKRQIARVHDGIATLQPAR